MSGTLSNLGFKIAMSAVGVPAVVANLLNGWESKSGTGWSTNTVETNTVDGDGYSKKTGILKTGKDITIKFFKEDLATYNTLKAQYHGVPTSDPLSYVDFSFIAPKRSDWVGVRDIVQTCQITEFSEGDANTADAQTYSITLTPSGAPSSFAGFGTISTVTGNPDSMASAGGNTVVTVAGTGMTNRVFVRAIDPDGDIVEGAYGYTVGSDTSQVVTIALPKNKTEGNLVYTIKASLDNGCNFSANVDTVTVLEAVA